MYFVDHSSIAAPPVLWTCLALRGYAVLFTMDYQYTLIYIREAVIKKNQNVNFFQKGKGGVDPKVYIFEILNFGKFQVSKWASGMKRLFKVSFKN